MRVGSLASCLSSQKVLMISWCNSLGSLRKRERDWVINMLLLYMQLAVGSWPPLLGVAWRGQAWRCRTLNLGTYLSLPPASRFPPFWLSLLRSVLSNSDRDELHTLTLSARHTFSVCVDCRAGMTITRTDAVLFQLKRSSRAMAGLSVLPSRQTPGHRVHLTALI